MNDFDYVVKTLNDKLPWTKALNITHSGNENEDSYEIWGNSVEDVINRCYVGLLRSLDSRKPTRDIYGLIKATKRVTNLISDIEDPGYYCVLPSKYFPFAETVAIKPKAFTLDFAKLPYKTKDNSYVALVNNVIPGDVFNSGYLISLSK